MTMSDDRDIRADDEGRGRRRHPLFKGQDKFLEEARARHGDLYDYDQAEYAGLQKRIFITCGVHGPYPTTPASHLAGFHCYRCHNREGELAVRTVLDRYGLLYAEQWSHPMLFWKQRLRVDFCLLEGRVFIEFDEAHHRAGGWYGDQARARDQRKDEWAAANGYLMVRLTEISTIEEDLLAAGVLDPGMLDDPVG